MPAPPLNQFGQDLYDRLQPIQGDDESTGWVLACICGAIGIMYDEVEQLVRARAGRQPWQQAFDINQAPDFHIPWLGQCIGVRVTPGISAMLQRAQVRADAGFYRGGIDSLVSSIQETLTGSKAVLVIPRAGADAWQLEAFTNTAETPDPTATNNAGQAAKVAGLILTVSQRDVPVVDDATRTVDASTGTCDSATFADIT